MAAVVDVGVHFTGLRVSICTHTCLVVWVLHTSIDTGVYVAHCDTDAIVTPNSLLITKARHQ